jgi:predicted N-acetyltransferase YhbS
MVTPEFFCLPATALRAEAEEFYRVQGRESRPDEVDSLLGLRDGHGLLALVRLCPEFGGWSLRSMQVRGDRQRQGLGQRLLERFVAEVSERQVPEVLCMPYAHLEDFYSRAGFAKLTAAEIETLPLAWWNRFDKHRNRIPSRPVILMRWRS